MAKRATIQNLKGALKSAIIEAIEENQELVRRIFDEAIEDAAMTKAIRVGRRSKKVSRSKIFEVLDHVK